MNVLEQMERIEILKQLLSFEGNRSLVAAYFNISRSTLYRKLEKYEIYFAREQTTIR